MMKGALNIMKWSKYEKTDVPVAILNMRGTVMYKNPAAQKRLEIRCREKAISYVTRQTLPDYLRILEEKSIGLIKIAVNNLPMTATMCYTVIEGEECFLLYFSTPPREANEELAQYAEEMLSEIANCFALLYAAEDLIDEDTLTESAKRYYNIIYKNSIKLRYLITALSSYYHMSITEDQNAEELCDIKKLVECIVNCLTRYAESDKESIKFVIDDGVPVNYLCYTDGYALTKALIPLIFCAVYSAPDKKVTFRLSYDDSSVRLTIEFRGLGISEERLQNNIGDLDDTPDVKNLIFRYMMLPKYQEKHGWKIQTSIEHAADNNPVKQLNRITLSISKKMPDRSNVRSKSFFVDSNMEKIRQATDADVAYFLRGKR